jgi:hypothetical protein
MRDLIAQGVDEGAFQVSDVDRVADRALALIDGFGIRTLIGDGAIPLDRARRAVSSALARDLGLGDALTQAREPAPSAARAASRPVRTAPSM